MLVAGACERRVHGVLDVGGRVVVGQRRRIAVEQRVGLERQVIERQVRRRERQRRREVGARLVHRLPRQAVHEVEVHVAEDHQRRFGRAARLVGVVHAAECAQLRGIEALDAERQPVHAGARRSPRTSAARTCPGLASSVTLRVGQQRHARADAGQQPVDRRGGEQARRAAADEDRHDLAAPDRRQRELEVGEQRVDVLRPPARRRAPRAN